MILLPGTVEFSFSWEVTGGKLVAINLSPEWLSPRTETVPDRAAFPARPTHFSPPARCPRPLKVGAAETQGRSPSSAVGFDSLLFVAALAMTGNSLFLGSRSLVHAVAARRPWAST